MYVWDKDETGHGRMNICSVEKAAAAQVSSLTESTTPRALKGCSKGLTSFISSWILHTSHISTVTRQDSEVTNYVNQVQTEEHPRYLLWTEVEAGSPPIFPPAFQTFLDLARCFSDANGLVVNIGVASELACGRGAGSVESTPKWLGRCSRPLLSIAGSMGLFALPGLAGSCGTPEPNPLYCLRWFKRKWVGPTRPSL